MVETLALAHIRTHSRTMAYFTIVKWRVLARIGNILYHFGPKPKSEIGPLYGGWLVLPNVRGNFNFDMQNYIPIPPVGTSD